MRYKSQFRQSFLIFVLLGATACNLSPTFLQTDAPQLSRILQVSEIRSIQLEDDWNGLSPLSPITAHYSLQPDATGFSGQANFSVGGNWDIKSAVTETQTIQIPAKNVQAFLDKLAASSYTEGEYHPSTAWTDDYPSLNITIVLQTGSISFYSSSQGENRIPWAMSYGGKTYIIDSSTPMAALGELDPYLEHSRLDALVNRVQNTFFPPPTAVHEPANPP